MRIQLLPEEFVVTAEMPKQDWCLLLPVLPALAADDRRETARQDSDAVNIMTQRISEFCPELSAPAVNVGLALGALEREREREIYYVHSASLAYEDGIVFMSGPFPARQ